MSRITLTDVTPAMLRAAAEGRSIMDATPEGIVRSEKIGQMDVVASTKMPKEMHPNRQAYERLGFTFGTDVDDVFVAAELPKGWTRRATDHPMWSDVLDGEGRVRVAVFYKAAFYDRRATADLRPRFMRTWIHKDSPGSGLRQDEEAFVVVDNADGSVVFRTPTFRCDAGSVAYKESQALVEAWLKENHPDFLNPISYWGHNELERS
jgi:hypothetical protein